MVALTTALRAADEDAEEAGGFLVDLLQNTLSGDSRYIRVTGLEGALSSQARIASITVSDDDGVWLTINNAQLDWNRLALLRGRFSVNRLSAEEIIVDRRPNPVEPPADLPAPEAAPFQLPELPVAVNIDTISAGRIELGAPVVGIPAELSLEGSLLLADGALETDLNISRLDRPSDQLDLTATFGNASREISLYLLVQEDPGGLLSELLNVPDRPSLQLAVRGKGPVEDFTADLALASDGQSRLSGQVTLQGAPPPEGSDQTGNSIVFAANIAGDVTPLLATDYRAFFGPRTQLTLDGRRDPDGRVEIGAFDLASNALSLSGAVDLAAGGAPERVQIDGRIAPPEGAEVVLPLTGPRTAIRGAEVSAKIDRSVDNSWTLALSLDGLTRPGLELARAEVNGKGRLDPKPATLIDGTLSAALDGLALDDPALASALGESVALDGAFALLEGGILVLDRLALDGTDYAAELAGRVDGLTAGFQLDGTAEITASDLSRFAGLAGREIGGSAVVKVAGSGQPLGGAFDVDLDLQAEDLRSGIDQLDPLITGSTELALNARRDADGLRIERLTLDGTALTARASGDLRSDGTDVEFDARLDDLGRVVPDASGPVTASGALAEAADGVWSGQVRVNGPTQSYATFDGSLHPEGDADLTFDLTLNGIERFVTQLSGSLTSTGTAQRRDGTWTIDADAGGTAGVTAKASGTVEEATGAADVTFGARLTNLGSFVPQMPGPATVSGNVVRAASGVMTGKLRIDGPDASFAELDGTIETDGAAALTFDAALARIERFQSEISGTLTAKGEAQRSGTLWRIDSALGGPAGIDATVAGSFDQATMRADLASTGQVQLGIANRILNPRSVNGLARFDLRLAGPPALNSLSGTITTSGATVVLPNLAQTLTDVTANVALSGGQANVTASAAVRAGGRLSVSGLVSLSPPFDANLTTQLQQVVLTDNISFTTTLDGQLVYSGPLTGNGNLTGQIVFGESEINLAAASGAVGAAPIPEIDFRRYTPPPRDTRARAGLLREQSEGRGSVIGLDISLIADSRIFVRGRGVQAELGGRVQIGGTTKQLITSGQIELIRGHVNFLGRRLELTEGRVTLQGDLNPYIELKATTSTDDGEATLQILGPLSAPVIEITSSPERPTEEALAMLVFGNRFSSLSPLQIAELASQLAALNGGGPSFLDRVRERLGLATVDVGTDEEGNANLGVGTYLADDVYTDVTVNTRGETELSINLDLTDNLKVRGVVDNSGDTGFGLFFQRDY